MAIKYLPARQGASIREFQERMVEVGRIRIGEFNPEGKGRPVKLDRFRFTSADQALVGMVAEQYGGEVEEYRPQRTNRVEWAVTSDAVEVPVYVPQQKIEPWLEAWRPGTCIRRCDGEWNTIGDGSACACVAGQVAANDLCKPVVRVQLMLAEVPGIGTWRLESHGEYACAEMSTLAPFIASVPMPIPAMLRLREETRRPYDKVKGKHVTNTFYVPFLSISVATPQQIALGGDALSKALNAAGSPVLGTSMARELEGRPADHGEKVAEWLDQIGQATTDAEFERLHGEIVAARRGGLLDDAIYEKLGRAWSDAKAGALMVAHQQQSALAQAVAPELAAMQAASPVQRLADALDTQDPGLVAMAEKNAMSVAATRAAILAQIEACDTTGAIEDLVSKLKAKSIGDEHIKGAAKARYAAIVAAAEVGGSAPGATSVTAGNADHQAALRKVQQDATEVVDSVLVDDQGPPPAWATDEPAPPAVTVPSTVYDLDNELNAVYTAAGPLEWTTTQINAVIKREVGVASIAALTAAHAQKLHILATCIKAGQVQP